MVMNPPDNFITFDGKSLFDFGVRISGDKTFGGPERDVEEIEIPGRSGTLTLDKKRFKNYTLEYEASILGEDTHDFEIKIDGLRNYLLSKSSYKRLEDTYHPDEYRMAKYVSGFDPEVILLQGAKFTLQFDVKPQRYLKEGEEVYAFTKTGTITNPTLYNSKPNIRVWGAGNVGLGNMTIVILAHSNIPYIDINSEIVDCYYNATNCNKYVQFIPGSTELNYPVIEPGTNGVTVGSGITRVEITPNYFYV